MKLSKMENCYMYGRKKSSVAKLTLIILFSAGAAVGQTVQTEYVDGIPWIFSVSNDEATLIGCLKGRVGNKKEIKEKLVIPSALAGAKVTTIRDDVFVRSFFWHGETREVVRYIEIPASVANIAPKSFAYFLNLQQIEVVSSNGVYRSEDGVLYRRGQAKPIAIPRGRLPDKGSGAEAVVSSDPNVE